MIFMICLLKVCDKIFNLDNTIILYFEWMVYSIFIKIEMENRNIFSKMSMLAS